MKSLKILIFSLAALAFSNPDAYPQTLAVRAGIYDFTGNTASEFYILAPTIMIGYDAWTKSRLAIQISAGFSYNSIRYDDHRHQLYMVPLLATVTYNLPNPEARIWPVLGMGIGVVGKADRNISLVKTHYSLAYGFHATGGLRIPLKEKIILSLDLTYNLLIPPVMEEINISGIILMAGLCIPLK